MSSKPKKSNAKFGTMPNAKYVQTVADLDIISEGEVTEELHEHHIDEADLAAYESYEEQDRLRHLRNNLVEVGREIEFNLHLIRGIDDQVNTAQKREDNPRWQEYLKERDQLIKNRQQLHKQWTAQLEQYEDLKEQESKFWKLDGDNNPYLEAEDNEAHSDLFEKIVDLSTGIKSTNDQRDEYIKREEQLLSDYHNAVADDRFEKRKELGGLLQELDQLRAVYNHSFTEIAECAGVHPRTMREYLNGKRDLPMEAFQKFEKLGPKYVELIQAVRHDDIRMKAWQDFEAHLRMLSQDHEARSIPGIGTVGKPVSGDDEGPFDLTRGQCPECGSGQDTTDEDPAGDFGTKVTRTKTNTVVSNEETGAMGMDYAAKGLPQEDVLVARERTCLNPDCVHRWWTYEVAAKTLDDVYMNAHKYESISKTASEALKAADKENSNVVQLGLFGNSGPPTGWGSGIIKLPNQPNHPFLDGMLSGMKHQQREYQTAANKTESAIQLITGERKKGEELVKDAPKKSPETIGGEVSVKEKLRKLQELKGLISDEKFSQKEDALMKEFGID